MNTNDQPGLSHWESFLTSCGGHVAVGYGDSGGCLLNHETITSDESSRILALEKDNARLQRLVAELLIKNEQLRQMYLASSAAAD